MAMLAEVAFDHFSKMDGNWAQVAKLEAFRECIGRASIISGNECCLLVLLAVLAHDLA